MGAFDEMKGELVKTLAMLGAIIGFVVLFLAWSALGTWAVVLILAVIAGGFYLYMKSRGSGVH